MIENHIQHPELVGDNTLHVIGVVSNSARWHSRYRLARKWIDEMRATPHVELHLVEAAFGDRHHEVASKDDGDLLLRTGSEVWIKENLINLGVRHLLPRGWSKVAWIDADVAFRDPNWAQETLHQLQHFDVVQPWWQCTDLGPHGDILQTHQSFGRLVQTGTRMQRNSCEPYAYGHSGYAWACTRAFWERVGGLLDFCILGSADHHMAWGMIGDVDCTVHGGIGASYLRRCREWQARAVAACHKDVGATPGRIEHSFHGPKARRYYKERWQILVEHHFDPDRDLMYDDQGLIQLVGKPELERAIRKYNQSRCEDSIEAS